MRALAGEGCDVVVADIDSEAAAAREVEGLGRRALAVAVDVADPEPMGRLADDAFEFRGTVEVPCLNAGVLVWGAAHESTVDDWRWVLDDNLMGVVKGVRAFLQRVPQQGTSAHVVNIGSVAGLRGQHCDLMLTQRDWAEGISDDWACRTNEPSARSTPGGHGRRALRNAP